ncbi:helix-turn-helix transcriptional regulator [Streptomyces angustmyceticus]|uniref:helix-turn-helix transcriptional regulator n=1 Tax=Streptomyces angustmyceticus TaxID=285578 RepID=UPI0021AED925|nr:LuxR C-terminal-related transcriptional regulator [Streptomyces angustmyceticus]
MTSQHYADPMPLAAPQAPAPRTPRASDQPATGAGRRPLDHQQACMASLDATLAIVAADAEFFRLFGQDSTETCGRSLYSLLHPSAPALLNRHFARLAEGQRTRFVERMVGIRSEEVPFSGELTGIAVRSEAGLAPSFVVVVRPDDDSAALPRQDDAPATRRQVLTELDAQILEGVASGASTVQLAARLYLSRQGVEYHVGLMLRRLKAPNRAALVARAHSMGMLTIGSWPPRVLPEFVKDADNRRSRGSRGSRADSSRQRAAAARTEAAAPRTPSASAGARTTSAMPNSRAS